MKDIEEIYERNRMMILGIRRSMNKRFQLNTGILIAV